MLFLVSMGKTGLSHDIFSTFAVYILINLGKYEIQIRAWKRNVKLEVPNLVGAMISASVNLCVMQHP